MDSETVESKPRTYISGSPWGSQVILWVPEDGRYRAPWEACHQAVLATDGVAIMPGTHAWYVSDTDLFVKTILEHGAVRC